MDPSPKTIELLHYPGRAYGELLQYWLEMAINWNRVLHSYSISIEISFRYDCAIGFLFNRNIFCECLVNISIW